MNSGGYESAWEEVWLGGIVEERAGRICGKCSWACKGVWLDRWVEQLKKEQGECVVGAGWQGMRYSWADGWTECSGTWVNLGWDVVMSN